VLVGNSRIGRKFDEIVCFDGHDVGEEIASRQRKILNDKIDCVVGILDTGDGNVADLVNERGTITFRMSLHNSGLNFKLPSLSNNKSLVSLAQSSPKRLLVGSSPMALNQSPTDENKLFLYFPS